MRHLPGNEEIVALIAAGVGASGVVADPRNYGQAVALIEDRSRES